MPSSIISFACLCLLTPISRPHAADGGDLSILMIKRASELRKQRQAAQTQVNLEASGRHHVESRATERSRYAHNNDLISRAKKVVLVEKKEATPAGKPPLYTDTKTSYVADLTIPIKDERGNSITHQTVQISFTQGDKPIAYHFPYNGAIASIGGVWQDKPNQVIQEVKDGVVTLPRVPLPATVAVTLPGDQESAEWRIEGDMYSRPLEIPDKAKGKELPGSKKSDPIIYTKLKGQKVGIKVVHITEELAIVLPEPVTLRREVADFIMPKPRFIAVARDAKSTLTIGSKQEGQQGLQKEDDGQAWHFRIRRNELSKDDTLVLQSDTPNGSFGGSIDLGQPNYYEVNTLKAPDLVLEAVPSRGIYFAGKPVDEAFPLSPIQWQGKLLTGNEALAMLGVSERDPKKNKNIVVVDPTAGKNHRGRYGRWFRLLDKGLELRCRYDPDSQLPSPPLPASKDNGLVEAIRIISHEGGQIGDALYVGAARDDIANAFGPPDPPLAHLEEIGLDTPAKVSLAAFGDKSIAAWTDTYLYGGIRIGYVGDRVSWFEIARPVSMLYDGARAFVPDEARKVFLGEVKGDSSNATSAFRRALAASLRSLSGMTQIQQREQADYALTGFVSTSKRSEQAYHKYTVEVVYYDNKGKKQKKYEDREEGFKCDEAYASVNMSIELTDLKTDKRVTVPVDALSGAENGPHKQGEHCRADPDSLLDSLLSAGRMQSQFLRPLNRIASSESNILGTVLAVNYDSGQILINLGSKQGIHDKSTAGSEVTELSLLLADSVDLKTGEAVNLDKAKLLAGYDWRTGKRMVEWLEVQKVGEDWCVAKLKRKSQPFNNTVDAFGQIPRLLDAGSGLVRVRIAAKKGK